MRKLLKSKGFKFVADVALGFISPPLKVGTGLTAGIVSGVKNAVDNERQKNLNSGIGGQGNINYARIIGYLILLLVIILYVFGGLDQEKLNFIVDLLNEFNIFEA